MPRLIIKPAPSDDYYVMWSTIVDAPVFGGTKDAFISTTLYDAESFDRADRNGTSAAWPALPDNEQPYGWSDDDFLIREVLDYVDGHYHTIKRANLREACNRLAQREPIDDLVDMHPEADQ